MNERKIEWIAVRRTDHARSTVVNQQSRKNQTADPARRTKCTSGVLKCVGGESDSVRYADVRWFELGLR